MKTQVAGRRTRRRQTPDKFAESDSRLAGHAEIARMAEAEAGHRQMERRAMIADAAYFRAEKRGFEPGHELDDWLAAEVDVANAQQLDTLAPEEAGGLRRVS